MRSVKLVVVFTFRINKKSLPQRVYLGGIGHVQRYAGAVRPVRP